MTEDDFAIQVTPGAGALVRGVMRLESVDAYDRVFAPLRSGLLAAACTYSIDLRELVFLNSSGIRALCELVLLAKSRNQSLELVLSPAVPWQRKSLSSLQKINEALKLRFT